MLSNLEYLEEYFFARSLVRNSSDKSQFLIFLKIRKAASQSCGVVVETANKREQRHKAPEMLTHVPTKRLFPRLNIKSVVQWRSLNSIQSVIDFCLQQLGHVG
ncbi:hypothetical protein Y032_0270g877 [Ancylostoma ceylanicum]|uniref:Uncharacterized protein n=1 Tax=Ancylostoma ceylanicum TaxID=53326 RepID=A0A016S8P2_9BILA|nr:hypothetical protein Y032_0270g877 [Ancylostoma ceylanicum]